MNRTHTRSIRNLALAVAAAVALSACGPLGASEPFTISVGSVDDVVADADTELAAAGVNETLGSDISPLEAEEGGVALEGAFCAAVHDILRSFVPDDVSADPVVLLQRHADDLAALVAIGKQDPSLDPSVLEGLISYTELVAEAARVGDVNAGDDVHLTDSQVAWMNWCGVPAPVEGGSEPDAPATSDETSVDFCAALYSQLPTLVDADELADDLMTSTGMVADIYADLIEVAEGDPNFPQPLLADLALAHRYLVHFAEYGDFQTSDLSETEQMAAIEAHFSMLDYCGVGMTMG